MSKQPIRNRYLGHMTGYQPILIFPDSVGSCFLIFLIARLFTYTNEETDPRHSRQKGTSNEANFNLQLFQVTVPGKLLYC